MDTADTALFPSEISGADTNDASLHAINIVEALNRGVRPDSESSRWIIDGLTNYIRGSDLSEALNLAPESRQRLRLKMRNFHLRLAWELVDVYGKGASARSQALAEEIHRFVTIVWIRVREINAPYPNWSKCRCAIWRARQFGELPESARQLQRICNL